MVWMFGLFWVMAKVEECFERMMENPKWAVSSQVKLNIIELRRGNRVNWATVEVNGWLSAASPVSMINCDESTHFWEAKLQVASKIVVMLFDRILAWWATTCFFNWNVIKGSWEIHQFKPLRGLVSGRSPSTGPLNRKLPGRYRQSTAESAAKRAWETPGKCYSNGKPACFF